MIKSNDIERSRGEKKASEEDELRWSQLDMSMKCGRGGMKYLMRTKSCIMNLWRAFVGWVI